MSDNVVINLGERKNGKSTQIVDCLHTGDTDYTASGGIDISVNNFTPTNIMTGLHIGEGSGNISVLMEGDGVMILPFVVSSEQASLLVFLGHRIKSIYNVAGGTSFSGKIWPVW